MVNCSLWESSPLFRRSSASFLACSLVMAACQQHHFQFAILPRSDDGAVAVAAIDLRVLSWTNLVAFSAPPPPLYQDTTAAEAAPVSAALGDAWESVGDGSPVNAATALLPALKCSFSEGTIDAVDTGATSIYLEYDDWVAVLSSLRGASEALPSSISKADAASQRVSYLPLPRDFDVKSLSM